MKPYGGGDFQSAMHGPDPRMMELAYLQSTITDVRRLIEQSQPLVGPIFTEQGPMEVVDAMAAFEVGPVLYRFGTWVVTEDGVACLTRHYPLTRARLQEHEDWASHLAEQPWANLWDVVRALVVAEQRVWRSRDRGPFGDDGHPR